MWFPLLGLILGLITGLFFVNNIFIIETKYLAIIALSTIDFIFIGLNAKLNNYFYTKLFTIEFILSTIIAISLVYLGDIMNVDLFVAIIIVFSMRIFYNFSALNRQLFFKQ